MHTNVGTSAKKAIEHIDVRAIITVTARLAQLMAEEVDLLADMKVSKIEALQNEKIFLTNALDAQKKLIAKHPHVLETIPSQDKQDLREVVDVFDQILQENHRKLLLARNINHQIVKAITSVVTEYSLSKTYDGQGATGVAPYETLSVTLNKTI